MLICAQIPMRCMDKHRCSNVFFLLQRLFPRSVLSSLLLPVLCTPPWDGLCQLNDLKTSSDGTRFHFSLRHKGNCENNMNKNIKSKEDKLYEISSFIVKCSKQSNKKIYCRLTRFCVWATLYLSPLSPKLR